MALSVYRNSSERNVVSGYVVNVHDAINFDIDLSFTSTQRYQYRHVITNEYEYKEKSSEDERKSGKAYRCRLKGIQLISHRSKESDQLMRKAIKDMIQMINRCDGWVVCVIDGADVYNRLLIDVVDPALFPEYYRSYREVLFKRYPNLFTKYIPQHKSYKRKQKHNYRY